MRLYVELSPLSTNKPIVLPIHYNRYVQGMIYRLIEKELPSIHDIGYEAAGRKFRLFVFSKLFGEIKKMEKGFITFASPVRLKIDSPLNEFGQTLADNIAAMKSIRLGNNLLHATSVIVQPYPEFGEQVNVKAISPITVYSTLSKPDGRKKTYYYHPQEEEFSELIAKNILKKAEILGKDYRICKNDFHVQAIKVGMKDQKIVYYGKTLVKGWTGLFSIQGNPELIMIAYSCGIGAKNSQGFGMLEVPKAQNVVDL